ncbi:MAG: hypothetical protein IJU76_02880 [Desulfovibrionaceae bacterium]|nr:hypothetical protein [Desulfovibrionaceae bacterium]
MPEKTNEIKENPEVIKKLAQNDVFLITYDAMGCQCDLADELDCRGSFLFI